MADRAETPHEQRWRLFLWLCAALREDRPDWPTDPADTPALVALASEHCVTPLLAVQLAGAPGMPAEVQDYLDAAVLLNGERNSAIMAGIETAAACLAKQGIPAVFLKGAAHLADGLYPDPASRHLGDVDLLVAPAAAADASRALAGAGFSEIDLLRPAWVRLRHHHLPMQRHVQSGVGIELHTEVLALAHPGIVSAATVLRTAVPARQGKHVLVPELRLRAVHAILHDQLDHAWRRRRIGLRTLCDLARLLAHPDAGTMAMDLARAVPRPVQPMIDNAVALAGLLGAEIDPARTERACRRLRIGMVQPPFATPDKVVNWVRRVRYQPLAVVNLLDPRRWRPTE